jgi:[acyl-carrier-protein] S-malonyltransferase
VQQTESAFGALSPPNSSFSSTWLSWYVKRLFMVKTALLFAGQGAQVVGMGKDLAKHSPAARSRFEEANSVLGYDLTAICFSGPDEVLTQTEHAQPGIYLVSWVAFEALLAAVPGLQFQATAGLSLGEFTALAGAGALSFQDGLRIVRQRGQLMHKACLATRGGMAAILGLQEGPTREACAEAGVELANLNCPGQLVISGASDRIAVACDLARARGAKRALPLPVAGAYHSRLMASAQLGLEAVLAGVTLATPRQPVIANVTAEPHGTPDEIRRRLVEQVTSPVRWEASMRHLLAQGFTRFIELGPGTALTGFLKRIDRGAQVLNVADVASLEVTASVLNNPMP